VPGGSVDLETLGAESRGIQGATDASGEFVFDHLKAGTYRLTGSLDARRSLPQDVIVAAGQNASGVTLSLSTGAVIFGKVTGLSPAEIATVRVHASGANGFNAYGDSDPSGSYEIDGAPPGAVNAPVSSGARKAAARRRRRDRRRRHPGRGRSLTSRREARSPGP
jgi:hypothetical protein